MGVAAFVDIKFPIVYLILPFFLYAVAWVQLRYILLMRRTSAYITVTIAPRVREIIQELSKKTIDLTHILNWEEGWKSPGSRQNGIWLLPILGAGYGLPLFAALLLISVYFFSVPKISGGAWILITINFLAITYSVILGFIIEFKRFGQNL